jgi:predicted pyridoxine 5'-phosphate oxidase superfamily flavin-nucleotide-binding protein
MPPRVREFVAAQPFAIVASRDAGGAMWASLLTGAAGLLQPLDERFLHIAAAPAAGDPLAANLVVDAPLGLLVIDPASKRRVRINGTIVGTGDATLLLDVGECFGNCPKYIQPRAVHVAATAPAATQAGTALSAAQQERIRRADTFFIASQHARAGLDVSHRGGAPGFVDVLDATHLAWPDYSGNMMFQTLGNLTSEPRAGLLFIDFTSGDVLQLSGRATVDFDGERAASHAGAQRMVDFAVTEVRDTPGSPLREHR